MNNLALILAIKKLVEEKNVQIKIAHSGVTGKEVEIRQKGITVKLPVTVNSVSSSKYGKFQ